MNVLVPPTPPICAAPTAAPPAMRRELADDVLTLIFDRPDCSANIIDESFLRELDSHLAWAELHPELRGVVLLSAKNSIFLAGADLKSFRSATPEELAGIIELGQAVFSRLARLPVPKVAAMHGACLGGGCELALACDWRLATTDKSTQIGFPEVQLGILPAWGGCTRLPRLLGLAKALPLILQGRAVHSRKALRLGLIDHACPREVLQVLARKQLACGMRPATRGWARLANSRLAAAILRRKASRSLRHPPAALYPAPSAALDVMVQGLRLPEYGSLQREKEAFLHLIRTAQAENLMRVHFLAERAKKFGSSVVVSAPPITQAAVIGAGVMGAGITQWLASRGIAVSLHDISAERVAAGLKSARMLCDEAVGRGLLTAADARAAMDRILPATPGSSLASADIVIEAATEDLPLKQKIFRDVAARSRPDAILATNTSALSVEAIASCLPRPTQVVGMHFFNPVSRMKLIEIVTWPDASREAVNRVVQFTARIGKLPVLVHDSPGFVVNRILMPYLLEAVKLFDHGADPGMIDRALLEFGMPMGPLRLLDEVGLDVAHHVARTLCDAFPGRLSIPEILPHLVEAGMLGKKSGRGFFLHSEGAAAARVEKPNPAAQEARQHRTALAVKSADVRERLLALMINESAYCVLEGVVQSADDVDLAMLMGAGFAPLHGGPLRCADAIGAGKIVRILESAAHATGDPLYHPCPLLVEKMVNRTAFLPA